MHAGSGPRYVDWSHLHVPEGERDAAAPYVPEARKLLGFVMDEAKRNGLGSHKLKRTLKDGTVIIAEKIGSVPRMTIIPKGGKPPIVIRVLEGFFMPRSASDTPRFPGLLVPPAEDEEESDWRVAFYSSEDGGFDLAPEDRRGTYIDVFGTKTKQNKRLDPAGGMWLDRDTQEAVTWFRGYLGYWPMHYRHPITNYSDKVQIYGHDVYTTPFPEWRVLAAAKRDMWLYVMLCENLGALDPPARPGSASESGQVWCSQPYTDEAYNYAVWRYPLGIVTQPDTLIDTYKAGDHDLTGEQLWSGSLELAYGAWSFNADCTEVVTIQLPRICAWYIHVMAHPSAPAWVVSNASFPDYPVSAVKRLAINISHGVGTPSASYAEEPAPTTIAEEDGVKLELVQVDHATEPATDRTIYSRMEFQCGDFAVDAVVHGSNPEQFGPPQTSRTIVYAHIPSKTFLFLLRTLSGDSVTLNETVDLRYELYVNGVEVPIADDPDAVTTSVPASHPYLFGEIRYRIVAPWFALLNEFALYTVFQNIDAMTVLLGIEIDHNGTGASTGAERAQAIGGHTRPYIPFTSRLDNSPLPGTLGGAISANHGAGGWSRAKYGGPGPTWSWDDGNIDGPAVYFNAGEYLDPAPTTLAILSPFGGASQFEGDVAIAVKLDPWNGIVTIFEGDNPYPFTGDPDAFYPLRYATNGDARPLIDAIDENRLASKDVMYYVAYQISHTGKPMPRQRTRFAA